MHKEKLLSVFKLLTEAGEAILEIYKSDDFQMELKYDNSPVTLADKNSSAIINNGLTRLFPDISIINEENPIADFKERKNWVQYFLVDPLDGTKEFLNRNGEFCINLALIKDSIPVEGWIYQPLEKRGWYCSRGKGVYEFDEKGNFQKIDKREKTSSTVRIVMSRSFYNRTEAKMIEDIKKSYPVEIIHRGSSLKQIDIILGKADMYLKAGPCSEWDTAPGQLMIEEYGGIVSRLNDFKSLEYNKPVMLNPHFVMLNSRLNNLEFIQFLQKILKVT